MPQRRVFLTRRATTWSALVPVVAVLAGVLFATSGATAKGTSLRSAATGIPDLIREQTISNERQSRRVAALQTEVESLTKAAEPGNTRVARLKERGDALAPMSGRTPAVGPMLEVSLRDSTLTANQIPPGFTVDDIVVHQQDVQGVVNALWFGGASAMMIQDQRVVSTSAVRCVGNTLILQGRVYSPPYVIRAIGDPARLRWALDNSPEVQIYREYVKAVGIGYQVRSAPRATFPAYVGSITPEYARAAG